MWIHQIRIERFFTALCTPHGRDAREVPLDALYADSRRWYDGYLFAGEGTPVYNPFSTLHCMQFHDLGNHWIDSGTSTMLYERVVRQPQSLPSVRGLSARILDLEVQDPLAPDTPSLMYDAEYLSLRQDPSGPLWVDLTNPEVGLSFSRGLLQWQARKIQEQEDAQGSSKKKHLGEHMESAFRAADYEAFGNMFNTYLRRFPFSMFLTPASQAAALNGTVLPRPVMRLLCGLGSGCYCVCHQ